jgi:GNAT superfamily N-acetyltransferase
MLLSFVLYDGLLLLATGVALVLSGRRKSGVAAIVTGVSAIAVAIGWPAREQRVMTRTQRIDDAMPRWQFNEKHAAFVNAPPERVFDAIKKVTARDIRLFETLTTIRRFGRPLPDHILHAPPDEPLLDLVTRTTFVSLADEPPREVVVGTCVARGVNAVMNFHVSGDERQSYVTTETRVFADSAAGARKFAAYWRLILPGSDIIRRMWLRAIQERAEWVGAPLQIRKAALADVAEIERVMRESLDTLGRTTYDDRQIASSLENIAHLDRELVTDDTYYVAIADGRIVGCGGWSRRGKLYAGSAAVANEARLLDPATEAARIRAMFVVPEWARRGIGRGILNRCEAEAKREGFRKIELMAMLSGEAMYTASGYDVVERVTPPLADGTPLPLTRMEKTIG